MRDVRPSFSHLRRLVDERGIWQHAVGTEPNPAHGYCLDDAARAAIVLTRLASTDPQWRRPLDTCRRFVDVALAGAGAARNFMDASGRWLDPPHHGDHVGRAIWALGVLSADTDDRHASWAADLLVRTAADQSRQAHVSLHTQTYALLGFAACGDREAVTALGGAALDDLCARLPASAAWPWPERSVRYDAGRIPQAMIAAGQRLHHHHAVDAGLGLLDWLTELVAPGHRPHHYPGCVGLVPGAPLIDTGDEQPLEAAAFAAAHAAAAGVTGSPLHATQVRRALAWFHGDNRLATPLVDDHRGACHDGLGRWTRNDNCGAESTIAYVETWLHAEDHCPEPPSAVGRHDKGDENGP